MSSSSERAAWSRRQLLQCAAAGAAMLPALQATAQPAGRERRKVPKAGRKRAGFAGLWPADAFVGETAAGRASLAWTN